MTAILAVEGLRTSYGRHQVLAGVDLTVEPGQLVAVVGENGAGKSTLLGALAGTLNADAGSVTLSGTLGYCPQEAVLSDSLTVGQHLRYFAAAHREFVHALADHHPSDGHDDMAVLALRTPGRTRPD